MCTWIMKSRKSNNNKKKQMKSEQYSLARIFRNCLIISDMEMIWSGFILISHL